MHSVEPYPEGVVPIPEVLEGTAFFLGGYGLAVPSAEPLPTPVDGVMVLGHDFYSEAGYRRFLADRGKSTRGQTWRNLLALFARVGLRPERCFFTNTYMGLRAGSANTGRFPGARDPGFVERCRLFLAEQIGAQQPRLVLALGSHVPAVLAPPSRELIPWRDAKTPTRLDERGVPLVPDARFPDGVRTSVAALVQPQHTPRERPPSALPRPLR